MPALSRVCPCALFIVMFYYSKLTKRLKLNNAEALAYGLWNEKCEITKDRSLIKLFKINLEDKSMESLDLSFSIHIKKLIDRHRLEKYPDINALKRYIEKGLS